MADWCRAIDTAMAVEFEVTRNDAELVLHIGDVSYADGDPKIWRSFMDAIEPYASLAPYMVAVGNHDYDYEGRTQKDPSVAKPLRPNWGKKNYAHDSGGECGVALGKRFAMPSGRYVFALSVSALLGVHTGCLAGKPSWSVCSRCVCIVERAHRLLGRGTLLVLQASSRVCLGLGLGLGPPVVLSTGDLPYIPNVWMNSLGRSAYIFDQHL